MKFFTAEDFFPYFSLHPNTNMTGAMAKLANAKLEKEARVVYRPEDATEVWIDNEKDKPTHRALLINIEIIAKCEHKNTVIKSHMFGLYVCECGAELRKTVTYTEAK